MSRSFNSIFNYIVIAILLCNNITLVVLYTKQKAQFTHSNQEIVNQATLLKYKLKRTEDELILCNRIESNNIYISDSIYDKTNQPHYIESIIKEGDFVLIIPFYTCLSCIDNILIKIDNLTPLKDKVKIISPKSEMTTMYAYARRANLQNNIYYINNPITENMGIVKHEFPILCKIGPNGYITSAISYNNDNFNVIQQFINTKQ